MKASLKNVVGQTLYVEIDGREIACQLDGGDQALINKIQQEGLDIQPLTELETKKWQTTKRLYATAGLPDVYQ